MKTETYPRTLGKIVRQASARFKAVLLTGMRQVGKTTLLRSLDSAGGTTGSGVTGDASKPQRTYVTLDDISALELAKTEPALFFQTFRPPVLVDEVQYAPALFSQIKLLADRSDRRGDFWLTGSQQFSLMQNVTETLAGRVAIFELHGFSIYEREGLGVEQKPYLPAPSPAAVLRRRNLAETYETIWKGSLPEVALNDNSFRSLYYSSYIKTYIERDVRQLINIGNVQGFYNFLRLLAARTAQELNLSDIAASVGIAFNTAKSWISVLETSGLIFLLRPYSGNFSKRIVKRAKCYFLDTGLCAYLTSWPTPETLEGGAMSGAIFETFVISEIIKSHRHNGLDTMFYFYRDSNMAEIDLLIEQSGMLQPIEIKKSASPKKEMLKHFDAIHALDKPRGHGSLICLTDTPLALLPDVTAHSIWDI